MDRPAQVPDALAVDDAHLANPPLAAGRQVTRDQIFYLARLEGVQVQHAIDWDFKRLVHEVCRKSR
jgi:hypothetical protein